MNKNFNILITISLKFVTTGPVDNNQDSKETLQI